MTKPNGDGKADGAATAPLVRYSRSAALPALMLVTSQFRGAMAPTSLDRRWLFARMLAGEGDVLVGKSEVRLREGVLLALEPGDCIAPLRRHSSETRFYSFLLEPEFVASFVAGAFPGGKARLRRGVLGSAAVRCFDALWEAVSADAAALEQEELLTTFLETASDDVGAPLETNALTPPVARARKFIEERFADDVRLEQLEAEVGLSRFYLVRRFRAEVGMPPHAYQLALRLDRARVLVASGMALADVAARCGFTDQSHLTRHFRRAVGVAPGAYARSTKVPR